MPRIEVRRPRNAADVVGSLPSAVTPVFIVLKLTGVVRWSWWWVLSPLWLGGVVLVLLVSALFMLWCLGQWPSIALSLFRRRRQPPVIFVHGGLGGLGGPVDGGPTDG